MSTLIALALGLAVGYWWGKREGMAVGTRQGKVLALFAQKPEISNDDVEVALGVSDATATRVLDELEKSGELVQVGSTGSGVVYRRK